MAEPRSIKAYSYFPTSHVASIPQKQITQHCYFLSSFITTLKQDMKPIDDKKEKVTIRAVSHDEEGRKRVEKTELNTHNIDTIKYVEKKLMDKGIQRMERHPVDGIGIGKPPPKSGRGGKYTWEGPMDMAESELDAAPAALDEKDPNYVDDEREEKIVRGEEKDVGEVEVAKAAEKEEGVGRLDVDPRLKTN